jgi:MFS family permease
MAVEGELMTAPEAVEDVGGRRRALALLAVALTLGMTTWFSASAVIPALRSTWNLADASAAWLTIAVQLGFVAGAILSSLFNLADLVSLRKVILSGAAGAALANALLLVAEGPALAIPLRFATGFFLAGVYPPAFKLMATWTREARGTALGVLAGAISVGSATPHLVNALGGLDWRVVVVVTSGLTFAGGAIAFALVREGPFPFAQAIFDPGQIGKVLGNRGVRLASLGYFGHMWELFAMWAWFVAFFAAQLEASGSRSTSAAPLATFAVIAIGGVGCWLGGILGDRWGRTRITSLMMLLSATCALLIGLLFQGPPWIILAVGLVWGFTVIADSAQFSTMVTELADQAYVGTALTLQLALGFTLTVATIWLIPELEKAFTWRWAFAFLVPGPLLGAIAMLRLRSLPEASQIAQGRG